MLLLTLTVQVKHSLTNLEEMSFGGRERHRRRRESSPLGVVGSLVHYTIGLATEQSYQELQVHTVLLSSQMKPFKVIKLAGKC